MSTTQVLVRCSIPEDPNKYIAIDYNNLSVELDYSALTGEITIRNIRKNQGFVPNIKYVLHKYLLLKDMWRLLSTINYDVGMATGSMYYITKDYLKKELIKFIQELYSKELLRIQNKNHQDLTLLLPRRELSDISIVFIDD